MNSLVKYFFVLCLMMLGMISVEAQNLIEEKIVQGEETHGVKELIVSPVPLKFSLSNPNAQGSWSVAILRMNDLYEDISEFEVHEDWCMIDPRNVVWRGAMRFFCEDLNRDCYKIRVRFDAKDGTSEEVIVNWCLLPSRPVISNVKFTYVFDWEFNDIYPNGDFSFDVESSFADRYILRYSESFLFSNPSYMQYAEEFSVNERIGYDADWGEFVCVESINSFGGSSSEVICTTSYIYDEKVLERIDEIKASADIKNVIFEDDGTFFVWKNNNLVFSDLMDGVCVYDMGGRMVSSGCKMKELDISSYMIGTYLVICTAGKKNYRTKILKK